MKLLIVSIKAVGASSCIEADSKMNLLFRDGTRLELKNNEDYNCDSKFSLYFLGDGGRIKETTETLRTKEIETMRVWTSKSYVEEDFTAENSKVFMKSFDCLLSK